MPKFGKAARCKLLSLTLIALCLCSQLIFAATSKHQVIIIGAGIAGLEAAHYLQAHGINDYIILEARDYIGGRAHTVKLANKIDVDVGATWIHGGGPDNPLMKIEKREKLSSIPIDVDSSIVYDKLGNRIDEEEYENDYRKFQSYLAQKKLVDSADINTSLSHVLMEYIQHEHIEKKSQYGLLYEISSNIEQNYAADIKDLSAFWFDNDEEFSGVDRIPVHGYREIVNAIAKNSDKHILLNHIVTQVDYQDSNAIMVTTKNGERFQGQFVICTLPIGVLKKGAVKFTPQLPQEKLVALEHLNMGTMNKIIMLFPKIFWNAEQTIGYSADAYLSGTQWINKGEWIEFDNMTPFIHQPVLSALISADFAKQVERLNDSDVIKNVMRILRVIYKSDIPEPTAYIITRWGQDPYSEGSYSSLRPTALPDGEDYVNMAKTINHSLLFAGEGTSLMYPSTVYGAYLTGDRAAQEVLTHLSENHS